jgi:integrase
LTEKSQVFLVCLPIYYTMRLLSQDDLIKILPFNKTAIDRLVSLGKIPYKRIPTAEGEVIRFSPDIISGWIKSGIDLSMDDKKYLERLKNKLESSNPEALKEIKKFSDQFSDPWEPKKFYLNPIPNKKLEFVYYVRYSENGKLVPSSWCTHTNNKEAAEKFAVENRERLLAKYYERKEEKINHVDLYSIFKNYYLKDSVYLQIDFKRGRSINDRVKRRCHNVIIKWFIPYLRKERIKDIEQIDTPLLARFQNHLLNNGVKPQSINGYISGINMIFNHLIIEGSVKTNPCASLIALKRLEGDIEIRGCYEITKLKGVFNKQWENEYSYLLCLLIYATGMRNSEIERIQVKDIITIDDCHFIDIPKSKSKNGVRIVPLHEFVYKKLNLYISKKLKTDEDYIFTKKLRPINSVYYLEANNDLGKFTGYTPEKLEAENISFYSGRHFWKTLMNSENLGDVEEFFMGHKVSGDVAKRYNHKDKQGREKLIEKTKEVFAILDKWIFR